MNSLKKTIKAAARAAAVAAAAAAAAAAAQICTLFWWLVLKSDKIFEIWSCECEKNKSRAESVNIPWNNEQGTHQTQQPSVVTDKDRNFSMLTTFACAHELNELNEVTTF